MKRLKGVRPLRSTNNWSICHSKSRQAKGQIIGVIADIHHLIAWSNNVWSPRVKKTDMSFHNIIVTMCTYAAISYGLIWGTNIITKYCLCENTIISMIWLNSDAMTINMLFKFYLSVNGLFTICGCLHVGITIVWYSIQNLFINDQQLALTQRTNTINQDARLEAETNSKTGVLNKLNSNHESKSLIQNAPDFFINEQQLSFLQTLHKSLIEYYLKFNHDNCREKFKTCYNNATS